jgi:hypothetical protein
MGRDSADTGVSRRGDLSETTLPGVKEWEKEVKSHFSLDNPDSADDMQLQIEILRLLSAIRKVQRQFFTTDELKHVRGSVNHTCQSMDQETLHKMFEQLKEWRYYDVIIRFLPKMKINVPDEKEVLDK